MLSSEQKKMVERAVEIEKEQLELKIELSTIARELGYKGVNVWDEISKIKVTK